MMEQIVKLLEKFLNEHFIPTLLSIAIMLIINILVPNECWMISKIGLPLFRILIFVLCFLLIEFIVWLRGFCLEISKRKKYKEKKKNDELTRREEAIKEYQHLADEMGTRCRDIIIQFVKTDNKPIDYVYWIGARDNYCINEELFFHKTKDFNNKEIIKLTEGVFKVYSYIFKEYGRIGNF